MPTPELKERAEGLLADMRRKYLHAKAMEGNPDWLKGEPLTARILEHWIPTVESLVKALHYE